MQPNGLTSKGCYGQPESGGDYERLCHDDQHARNWGMLFIYLSLYLIFLCVYLSTN